MFNTRAIGKLVAIALQKMRKFGFKKKIHLIGKFTGIFSVFNIRCIEILAKYMKVS